MSSRIPALGRLQAIRERREVDDVGEEDGGGVELVRDRRAVRLELLGDGSRQDVEEQVLGLVLLGAEGREGLGALLREDREQGEHDRPSEHDVEGQHRRGEPRWHVGKPAGGLSDEARREEDGEEGCEPADAGTDAAEDEGTERREDAP